MKLSCIVDPQQYRRELLAAITDEIKETTDHLGADYRVILTGFDKPMKWVRSGDLKLMFYIPYEFIIMPTSIHNYTVEVDEDDY